MLNRRSPTVAFATSCWEKDWRVILGDSDYLSVRQIARHAFPFSERLLITNNVDHLEEVKRAAQKKVDQGIGTRFVTAEDILEHFRLKRTDFNDWQFYNALGPLTAIHEARSDYLLYQTGDVYLKRKVNWIGKAIRFMGKNHNLKVANLTWNNRYREAKRESNRRSWNFYIAKQGFSDQMFLVQVKDFRGPIYGELRQDSAHYPRGDVFEKRIFSYMKNRDWERITYRHGSYTHENF